MSYMQSDNSPAETRRWRFEGKVQGVGFRPHVWRLAQAMSVNGQVFNEGDSACVVATAAAPVLDAFGKTLLQTLPPNAEVSRCTQETATLREYPAFEIVSSVGVESVSRFPLDTATCSSCLSEVRDPTDRRFGYAFTNCMDCGPRYSIIDALPYDRPRTSMADFPLCKACQAEYEDPSHRRFHAQPIACPDCGPRLEYIDPEGCELDGDPLGLAIEALKHGRILAVKGLGGMHLVCDATDTVAVAELRRRKHRPSKPFVVMVADLSEAAQYAVLGPEDCSALAAPANPVVLIERRGGVLADDVAPGQHRVGLMLPTTPLHHLLLAGVARPLVMTSGNISGQPQCIDNAVAVRELGAIVDGLLLHNRPIRNRLDDSVIHEAPVGRVTLRRGRGLAPTVLSYPPGFSAEPGTLAMGAHLKNTCALTTSEGILASPYIGDLASARSIEEAGSTVERLLQGAGLLPHSVVTDCHPDYASTVAGEKLARKHEASLIRVQHHHAHMAACLFENQVPRHAKPIIGVVLDGTGLSETGEIWGGEWLLGGYDKVARIGHLTPRPLLGGDAAMREPWRNLLVNLMASAKGSELIDHLQELPGYETVFGNTAMSALRRVASHPDFSPQASSAGRLIDAMAALLCPDLRQQSFEGEAGMAVEALALKAASPKRAYVLVPEPNAGAGVLDTSPLLVAATRDLCAGETREDVAWRLLAGLGDAVSQHTVLLAVKHGVATAALSGGVLQNPFLLTRITATLEGVGLQVLRHRDLPANDENIALGQAAVALSRADQSLKEER